MICALVFLLSSGISFAAPQAVRQLLEKAEFYFRGGNLKAAHTHLEQARAAAPDDPDVIRLSRLIEEARANRVEAALRAARFYHTAGNIPEAEKGYRAVLAVDPSNPDAKKAIESLQKVKDTVEKYRETGVSVPISTGRSYDVDAYSVVSAFMRAQAAFSRGDLDTTDSFISEILKREPTHARALELRESIRRLRHINGLLSSLDRDLAAGGYLEVVTALDRLLQEYPGRPDLLLKRGKALLHLKRPLEAVRDFERVLATTTYHASLLPALSDAYDAAGAPLKAAAVAAADPGGVPVKPLTDRLVLIWKSYPVSASFLLLGCLLLPASLAWTWVQFDRLSDRHPPSRLLLMARLIVRASLLGISDEQVENWQSLAVQTRHPWFGYVAGLLLLRRGDYQAAQEPLQKALESPPLAARAYYFLGILRGRLGQAIAGHDLEKSLLASLRGFDEAFIPPFLARLERELVEQFAPDGTADAASIDSLSRQAALELLAHHGESPIVNVEV